MKTYTKEQLDEIIKLHGMWLSSKIGGLSADLSNADLFNAKLSNADLSNADLSYAKTDKRYIQIACIGSRKGMTTYCFEDDKIWCGCYQGTLKEFEARVRETHKGNKQYLAEYLGWIKYVKSIAKFTNK